jgi:hypothetical protein
MGHLYQECSFILQMNYLRYRNRQWGVLRPQDFESNPVHLSHDHLGDEQTTGT